MTGEAARIVVPMTIGRILPLCPRCGLEGDVRIRREVVEEHRPDPIFGNVPYVCEHCYVPFGEPE